MRKKAERKKINNQIELYSISQGDMPDDMYVCKEEK